MNKDLTTDQALQILDTAIAGIPAKREEHQLLMDALTTLAKASATQKPDSKNYKEELRIAQGEAEKLTGKEGENKND